MAVGVTGQVIRPVSSCWCWAGIVCHTHGHFLTQCQPQAPTGPPETQSAWVPLGAAESWPCPLCPHGAQHRPAHSPVCRVTAAWQDMRTGGLERVFCEERLEVRRAEREPHTLEGQHPGLGPFPHCAFMPSSLCLCRGTESKASEVPTPRGRGP